MDVAWRETWTLDRFLAWDDQQEARHEFDGAHIVRMTGGSRTHQRLVTNIVRLLEDTLDPSAFDAVPEMRLEVAGRVRHPDVSIVAGPVAGPVRTLRDALVVFEIVSSETETTDRVTKREEYAAIPSLRRYVIVEQSRQAATAFVRAPGGWTETPTDQELPLPEVGVVLPLAAIYRGVRFA